MKLSILMPVYNEAATLELAVKRVLDVPYPCDVELVIVDDGSRDATPEIISSLADPRVRAHRHPVNRGKGAAVRTAAGLATGDYVLPCDADLEYAPEEIPELLRPVIDGQATVVFGTRTFSAHSAYSFWYVMGNRGVTLAANVLFNSWISDLETCYKLLPTGLYRDLTVRSSGFGMEAEITGKLLRRGLRPYEVPISYRARRRDEGKKLTWMDGVAALGILTWVRLTGARGSAIAARLPSPGTVPSQGGGRGRGAMPTQGTARTQGAVPAQGTAPACGPVAPQGAVPAQGAAPARGGPFQGPVPAQDGGPSQGAVPGEGTVPAQGAAGAAPAAGPAPARGAAGTPDVAAEGPAGTDR